MSSNEDNNENDENKKDKDKLGLIEVTDLKDLLVLSSGPMGSMARIHHIKIKNKDLCHIP